MRCILGTKKSMTQIFREDGTVVPVTRVQAGPCVVTQVKTAKRDGVSAVQVGFGPQKAFRLTKPLKGHLKDLDAVRHMRDFRAPENHGLSRGDSFTVSIFSAGDRVQVAGVSKGKGFQGVVKRHGFSGGPASHGHKDQLRMPGSIGSADPARVFKGMRMGGHMGDQQVTVKNLEILAIDEEKNELLVKGAVPGARGGLLMISTEDGKIDVSTGADETKAEVVIEDQSEDVSIPEEKTASEEEAVTA
ncbi:MAG: 50S ribosomal protein L3 [Candidatus Magasanikbacteria bacterium CG1_02_41_34]|nr:MAG: 50S ribosomal protein L3 [Candidatus Magasanikbacteria bacterium CG1_02_41_34]